MSSPMSVKRRKLNDATSTLRKPFVSPMRSLKTNQTPRKEPGSNGPSPYVPSTLAQTVDQDNPTPKPVLSSVRSVKSTPIRKLPPVGWSSSRQTDPEIQAAQKAVTSLELQIRKVQNDLDTLKQAQQITSSTTSADLDVLINKWRVCCQEVAEELFGSVKERVCRMGGVAAWREMEKQKHSRAQGFGGFDQQEEQDDDADCEFDSEGEALPENEQKYRKKMKRQAKQEMMDAADVPVQSAQSPAEYRGPAWSEEGREDDSFTIDMMLRSLNIDLATIGYDKEGQRWIN